MTRRTRGTPRFLTPDAYIRRATAGLPRGEEADKAAELRAHLLERTAEHQAQGFSREEAEYLAVRGMGEPERAGANAWAVWGRRLGWVAPTALVLGGGGYHAHRELLPPKEGVRLEAATPADIAALFADGNAPRGQYQAATLTFPQGTRTVVTALVSNDSENPEDAVGIFATSTPVRRFVGDLPGPLPGAYRYQERWLWTTERENCDGAEHVRIFVKTQPVESPLLSGRKNWGSGAASISDGCGNPKLEVRPPDSVAPGSAMASMSLPDGVSMGAITDTVPASDIAPALRLDHWTVLKRVVHNPARGANVIVVSVTGHYPPTARGTYLAVLPYSEDVASSAIVHYFSERLHFGYETSPVVFRLPPAVPAGLNDELQPQPEPAVLP